MQKQIIYNKKNDMENKNNLEEIWRDIVGYEGLYQVSNLGNVKSIERTRIGKNNSIVSVKEKIRKPDNVKGYLMVGLYKDEKEKKYYIHRLVAQTFIDNPDNLPQVNHIDEDKTNNRVDNLEWCDREYNINYGTRNERVGKAISIIQINHPMRSKRVAQIDKNTGDIIKIWPSTKECGRNGFNQGNISNCCRGKYKSACGYIWKYVEDE